MNPPLDFDQWLASKETPAAPEASALRLRIGPPADAGRPSASVALVGDLLVANEDGGTIRTCSGDPTGGRIAHAHL